MYDKDCMLDSVFLNTQLSFWTEPEGIAAWEDALFLDLSTISHHHRSPLHDQEKSHLVEAIVFQTYCMFSFTDHHTPKISSANDRKNKQTQNSFCFRGKRTKKKQHKEDLFTT